MPLHKAAAQQSRFCKEINEDLSSGSSASAHSLKESMNQDADMDFKVETPSLYPRQMKTTPLDPQYLNQL